MSEDGLDNSTESIDPRVQIELERLNSATDDINKLEVDLDGARDAFRCLLCESAARLDALSRKLGSCIEKARPYYEARMRASEAARDAQDAAVQYERANSAHSAAREMVYLAEQGLGGKCTLDPAWQEMLNHATQRVNEAETARALAGAQHFKAGKKMSETSSIAQKLQRELRKSIAKSSLSARRNLMMINNIAYQHELLCLPYFEMKAQFNQHLELQKIKVQALEKQVCNAKLTYADALRHLEQISDEIHRNRKQSKQYFEKIDFKQTDKNSKLIKLPDNTANNKRYSDPIASFPTYPYVESDAAVFYNQTYLPETAKSHLDEYKSLPAHISPKSSPTKLQKFPDEIPGYHNLPSTSNTEVVNQNGLTKSVTSEWTEINLDSSSPEDVPVDRKNDIPYERFDTSPQDIDLNVTPKKRLLTKQMTLPATSLSDEKNSFKSKIKLDTNISNWITRSSAKHDESTSNNSSRRQSLDNILGPTSEKVKEIFSHGIMMLNISSLTERRNSESKLNDNSQSNVVQEVNSSTSRTFNAKKIPSPLEKTLTYLTANNTDDDTTGSDTDSLASCDMLTDEQIQSLMLDRDIDLACEQMFGTPISEVCPKFVATNPSETLSEISGTTNTSTATTVSLSSN